MLGAPNRPKRKSPGGLLGCAFPLALMVVLIGLLSFLNLGNQLGLYVIGVVVLVALIAGYMWAGPKDLLVTTAVLVGLMGACFLLCTVLFLLNNGAGTTTTTGGFVQILGQ